MALNKNALIRYKTIDYCLRNRQRKWTLDDLIEKCSDALYEYEGKDANVSKRTVQLDIQMMRSDKLGYNAPIVVYDKKYYKYNDENYSIVNIPVTDIDVKVMNDAIQLLKQFKDFSLFKEMDGVLQRLEDSVYTAQQNQRPIIHLDKNELLKGLEYIDVIYDAIQRKKVLKLSYKSFKATRESIMYVHPQLLKEFNNRWFVLALHKETHLTLALDRIINIEVQKEKYYKDLEIDGDSYYEHVIGVTVSNHHRPQTVKFWIDKFNAPYVLTKPFHQSQEVVEQDENGVVFSIKVQPNFELERIILGFGDAIKVLSPPKLKERIANKLKRAVSRYN